MSVVPPKDDNQLPIKKHTPHLSFSRVNRYLHCPEQYRLYYIENLRPKSQAASLLFGQIVHDSLRQFFRKKLDPVKVFSHAWDMAKQLDIRYSQKESWEKLSACGQGLLEKFLKEEVPRIGQVLNSEKPFEFNVTGLDLPFIGVIDLIAEVEEKRTVVDFKTSESAYQPHESILSDQLTAYRLAEPEVEQSALWVLVKTKEPKIQWHPTGRNGAQLTEYLAKAGYVAHEIYASRFYKRPGKWCSWCDFLPVCLGNEKKVKETLVTVR